MILRIHIYAAPTKQVQGGRHSGVPNAYNLKHPHDSTKPGTHRQNFAGPEKEYSYYTPL